MAFINLLTPENVQSGIGEIVFLAPVSFFTSIKKPTPPFLFAGSSVMIFDTHTFAAGKNFLQILLAPQKNDFNAKTDGELGSYALTQELKCIIAGSYAEQHEFIKNTVNQPIIALVKDANCGAGFMYQVGTECVPAYLTTDFTTGTTKDGIKGYSCTISSRSKSVLMYAGDLLLVATNGTTLLQDETGNTLITEDNNPIEA